MQPSDNPRTHPPRTRKSLSHDLMIQASWQRCNKYGLDQETTPADAIVSQGEVRDLQYHHNFLINTTGSEVLPYYENILANSSCLIMLADQKGQVLNCWGDRRFMAIQKRRCFDDGARWSEKVNGTNAIGTALATGQAVQVQRDEHYLKANRFMIGSAAPIYDTNRELLGVLDVSSDAYLPQAHTLGMVRMMSQSVENRLIISKFGQEEFLLTFNTNVDNLDSQWAGLIAFNENGTIISANRRAEMLLRFELALASVEEVFGIRLFELKNQPEGQPVLVNALGKYKMYAMVKRPENPMALAPDYRDRLPVQTETYAGPTLEQLALGDMRIERCTRMAKAVTGKEMPLLIQGETGTGKKTFARAFHHASQRSAFPMITVNCAVIPEDEIEAELFGYQNPDKGSVGLIRKAHKGTFYIEEPAELPMSAQTRLLRVLEEKKVTCPDTGQNWSVDIRIIAASKTSLKAQVTTGQLREDLYYRISGLNLELPPLRERTDQIALIHHLHRSCKESSQPEYLSEEVLSLLTRPAWPGNTRQLLNVLQIALAMAGDDEIEAWHLPDDVLTEPANRDLSTGMTDKTVITETQTPARISTITETPYLSADQETNPALLQQANQLQHSIADETLKAYTLHKGNISRTAQALGISRNTLYKRLKELGIRS
ncbi:sigma-54-dependent Fis family transcriptional regulator [Oceanospirillum sediminis]|uniref:Sigma-54-dependent Fis family transcriptional regulator n=1 Tax=Oceanospirillum sediminis TaxID=2760088 RepID=A0A839IKG0_9GAMM|nr:sigma-54-dependent Fis family transcriptional regulator [Oceanospirillum sediminis]MBB1485200.1 sigma-54-dependent Fis family transcriptional regulator [Oceanospirillum sediminis]